MAIHKLSFDDFDEVDYSLIAIHTSLEDYRLAFLLNQKLPILLSKNKNEVHININEGETHFSRFTYEDLRKDIFWNLVQNKKVISINESEKSNNLFYDLPFEVSKKVYLLPELKKVDYFLKIENIDVFFNTNDIINIINKIDWISTGYKVETSQIKSKNNLIF